MPRLYLICPAALLLIAGHIVLLLVSSRATSAPATPGNAVVPPAYTPTAYTVRIAPLAHDGTAAVMAAPPPTATPTPRPAWLDDAGHVVAQLDMAQLDAVLLAAGWPEALLPQARAIAWCESRWRPAAVGDGGAARGLFQVHWAPAGWQGWFAAALSAGYAMDDERDRWADPVINARVSLYIYEHHGAWAHWTCRHVLDAMEGL